ncbi:MAG: EamA family transporter [bacterium]|nr:EamA family transporter [bacterium]
MTWLVYTLIATLLISIVNIIDKYLISKLGVKPLVPVMILGLIGAISAGVILAIEGFVILAPVHLWLAFICGILFILNVYFYFEAVKIEDISRIVPLYYLSPIYILVIAWFFLGERFSASKYIGILLIVSMAIVISMKDFKSFRMSRAFWYMILASVAVSIVQVITKYLLNSNEFWPVFAYIRLGAFVALIPVYWTKYPELKRQYQTAGKKPFGIIVVNETVTLFSLILYTAAIAVGFVTLVNALSATQPLFVLMFSVLLSLWYPQILKEELSKSGILIKLVAIILMFIGIMLIR